MHQENSIRIADIGDYLKVFAFFAVVLQSVLAFALKTWPNHLHQIIIGILYNLAKYTAPAFIFGILYTSLRTQPRNQFHPYRYHLHGAWQNLFVPTLWWTGIYLLVLPQVQQHHHYHSGFSFLWQFINGNAAPHLWYNTMMLQFIILMPFFWWLTKLAVSHPSLVTISTALFYLFWLGIYQVATKQSLAHWYLLDRVCLSFIIYGIYGGLAWQFAFRINPWLIKWRKGLILATTLVFLWTNWELSHFGFPIRLTNAPYYKVSMTCYSLLIIALVANLNLWQTQHQQDRSLTCFHWLATFAYRAFLSHVFWLYFIWQGILHLKIIANHLILAIILTWLITWTWSYLSAYLIHLGWTKFKTSMND